MTRGRKRLLALLLGGLFALLLAEVGLQILGKPRTRFSGWRSSELPAAELNQLGFRGRSIAPRVEGELVVVLLGDSQVEAKASPFEALPEVLLEQHLRSKDLPARVHSLGAGGYGQDQQLLVLREYLVDHEVDVVVIWQTPSNDLWNNVFPTHWPADGEPKPTYWLEGETLCGPTEPMGTQVTSSIKLVALYQRFLTSRDGAWEAKLPPAYQPLDTWGGEFRTGWESLQQTNPQFALENFATEKAHMATQFTPRSKRMDYAVALTRALLGKIEEELEPRGADLVLMRLLLPLDQKPSSEVVQRVDGRFYRSSRAQILATMLDVNRGFDDVPIAVKDEDYAVSEDDPHLNQRANDQVMRDLAEALAPRLADRLKKPAGGQ